MSDKVYWVWLSGIPGIGAKRFQKLIERFGEPKNVWEASESDLLDMGNVIGYKNIDEIIKSRTPENEEKAFKIVNNKDVNVYTLLCPEYPRLLKNIYDPPPVLYIRGNDLKTDICSISVVGSRRSSQYGRLVAKELCRKLAEAGVGIVSGLARGIDTAAHTGALEAPKGYTVAVLGNGVDYVYPPENRKLYDQIVERGTLVSEYPLGTQPSQGNFPARNRIISGLTKGVLVVEAGLRSGALITVDYALEQGRDVYALPGNINSPYSAGTNSLIKEGAKVVTCVEDILEEIGALNSSGNEPPSDTSEKVFELDFLETQVYNALQDGNKDMEELINITSLEPGRLNAVLTMMEIKGIIKQLPGKIFMLQWKA